MDGCQNYDPFLGTLDIRCLIIIRMQKETIILTTTHMENYMELFCKGFWYKVFSGLGSDLTAIMPYGFKDPNGKRDLVWAQMSYSLNSLKGVI